MARIAPARNDPKPAPACGEAARPTVAVPAAFDQGASASQDWQVESDLGTVLPTDAEIDAIIRLLGEDLDALFS
jgi:hypothetical protein